MSAFTYAAISQAVLVAVVGVLTVLGTFVTALISSKASKRQSDATLEAAAAQNETTLKIAQAQNRTTLQDGAQLRFANWQLRKREVFAEFLDAARAYRDAPSDKGAEETYHSGAHRALLVANEDLRTRLWEYVDDPQRLQDPASWRALVEALGGDARKAQVND